MIIIHFNDAIKEYLLNSMLSKSAGTYNFEKQHLKNLLDYFGNVKLETLESERIYQYIIELKSNNTSNATINKKIALLKRVYSYFKIACPFSSVKKLKETFVTYGTISKNSMNKLMSALPSMPLRDQVVVRLLKDTGLRLNELAELTWNCVDIEERFIRLVVTKNKKSRLVYFSVETQAVLHLWRERTGSPNLYNEKTVLLSRTKKPLSTSGIEQVLVRIRKQLNITESLSPHKFRHTLSTDIYHNNADLLFIQRILGHSSLDVTKRYIHSDVKKDRDLYDKVNKKDATDTS